MLQRDEGGQVSLFVIALILEEDVDRRESTFQFKLAEKGHLPNHVISISIISEHSMRLFIVSYHTETINVLFDTHIHFT